MIKFLSKSTILSLKAPTITIIDTFFYYFYFLLVIAYAIPDVIIKKSDFISSIHSLFPKILGRSFVIQLNGVKYIIRKNTSDIVLINLISEPWMFNSFFPKKGDIIIDIGAHVGKFSLLSAKLIGNEGKVIAIEPIPENFQGLLKNIELNGFHNIIPVNVAAYKEEKNSIQLSGSRDDNYSIVNIPKMHDTIFQVKGRTVDSIIRELNIEKINYVKLDVEGAELEVLLGMKSLIENNKIDNIFIEFHVDNQREVNEILVNFKNKTLQRSDHSKHLIVHYWRDSSECLDHQKN